MNYREYHDTHKTYTLDYKTLYTLIEDARHYGHIMPPTHKVIEKLQTLDKIK